MIYPYREHIEKFLEVVGVSREMYELLAVDTIEQEIQLQDVYLGEVGIRYVPVTHVDTIEAYGFMLRMEGEKIYYSGDANIVPLQVLDELQDGQIDRVYHDTCGLDYEGNSHTSLKKLKESIAVNYRNKVYCMHLDKHITKAEIIAAGFNVAE